MDAIYNEAAAVSVAQCVLPPLLPALCAATGLATELLLCRTAAV